MQQNCNYDVSFLSHDQRTKPTTTPKAARTTAAAPPVAECTPPFAAGELAAGLAALLCELPPDPMLVLPPDPTLALPPDPTLLLPPEPISPGAGDPEPLAAPAVLEVVELP